MNADRHFPHFGRVLLGSLAILTACLMSPGPACRADYVVSTYANVANPISLSFAPDGDLYVGRDDGANDSIPTFIHRVGAGGTPVVEYGNRPVPDPDAVAFDAAGTISGVPGSVLIGGFADGSGGEGRITAILPDGRRISVFGPSTRFANPQSLAFDSAGRFLFADIQPGVRSVFVSTGGTPTPLIRFPSGIRPRDLTIGDGDRIYTSGSDGVIRIFNPDGTIADRSFATVFDGATAPIPAVASIAFAPGGLFGTDLYAAVNFTGELLRINPNGEVTTIMTGLPGIADLAFGPDGAMYLSDPGNDRILRIAPAAVPEPSSILLLGAGGLALAISSRRRRGRGLPASQRDPAKSPR